MSVIKLIYDLITAKATNTLYKVKAESKGSERGIAKLLLNCQYGGFGRSNNTTSCVVVTEKELPYLNLLLLPF